MKKMLVILLSACLLFSLAACTNTAVSTAPADEGQLAESLSAANIGDYVTFGTYEQDNDLATDGEAIEWRVLAKENGRALLVSKFALDAQPYHEDGGEITWEDCSLREWLNEDFMLTAFDARELEKIVILPVEADKNPKYDTDPGEAAEDAIFLLSAAEAEEYFKDDNARICSATAYAKANGAYSSTSYRLADGTFACWWWLRTPGQVQNFAADVFAFGAVDALGSDAAREDNAVRPAMWVLVK